MSLKIEILSDEEFEALPYDEVGMSLGLADTNTNTAYVRYVANEELQRYLINHELEHLLGEDRDELHHDGKGVYYKGFGNVFSGMGQAIGGAGQSLGGALGNIAGGASRIGQSVGQGIGGAARSVGGFLSNPMQAFSMSSMPASAQTSLSYGANPSVQGSMGSRSLTSALHASQPSFGKPMSQIGQSFGQNTLSKFGAQGSQGMVGSTIKPSVGGSINQSYNMGQPSQQPRPQTPQAPQTQQGGGMLDQFGGKLMSGFGDLAANKIMSTFSGATGMTSLPRMPDISNLPSVQALKNFNFRGNMGELDPALQNAINRDFDKIDAQEDHDFRNRWKNVRPGADIENDSVFARDYQNLKDSQATRRADALAGYRMEFIKTNLGINQMEYERLKDMAQLDVDKISYNTGMSAIEAMNLKNMFGFGTSTTTTGTNTLTGGAMGSFLPKSPSTGGV